MILFKTKDGRFINLSLMTHTEYREDQVTACMATNDSDYQIEVYISDPDDIARFTAILDSLIYKPVSIAEQIQRATYCQSTT